MSKIDNKIHTELVYFIQICSWSLEDQSINQIATDSNLSWITVKNLLG